MSCAAEKAVMDSYKDQWDAAHAAYQQAIDDNEPPSLIAALLVVSNQYRDLYLAAKAVYEACVAGGGAGGVGG